MILEIVKLIEYGHTCASRNATLSLCYLASCMGCSLEPTATLAMGATACHVCVAANKRFFQSARLQQNPK